eukprot:2376365-Alexandrium_andersonii.AAC.1
MFRWQRRGLSARRWLGGDTPRPQARHACSLAWSWSRALALARPEARERKKHNGKRWPGATTLEAERAHGAR